MVEARIEGKFRRRGTANKRFGVSAGGSTVREAHVSLGKQRSGAWSEVAATG